MSKNAPETGSLIDGVHVIPQQRILDERGAVYHMLKRTDPHFIDFGEVYFSTVNKGVVKGWHRHRDTTQNYACIFGRTKVVLYDDRDGSRTHGNLMEVFLGPENYVLVVIPPMVWNGFKGLTEPTAIIANCRTRPHDPETIERADPFGSAVPYDWAVKHG